jgi:5-methylcytosine-specific restriction endonuclease McrA
MRIIKHIKDIIQNKAPAGALRSPRWPKVRAEHLSANPKCAVCESTSVLEVHHIRPFHQDPSLELDPKNLITLCESKSKGVTCHQFFGHLGDYKNENPNVVKDAKSWNKKLKKTT